VSDGAEPPGCGLIAAAGSRLGMAGYASEGDSAASAQIDRYPAPSPDVVECCTRLGASDGLPRPSTRDGGSALAADEGGTSTRRRGKLKTAMTREVSGRLALCVR